MCTIYWLISFNCLFAFTGDSYPNFYSTIKTISSLTATTHRKRHFRFLIFTNQFHYIDYLVIQCEVKAGKLLVSVLNTIILHHHHLLANNRPLNELLTIRQNKFSSIWLRMNADVFLPKLERWNNKVQTSEAPISVCHFANKPLWERWILWDGRPLGTSVLVWTWPLIIKNERRPTFNLLLTNLIYKVFKSSIPVTWCATCTLSWVNETSLSTRVTNWLETSKLGLTL